MGLTSLNHLPPLATVVPSGDTDDVDGDGDGDGDVVDVGADGDVDDPNDGGWREEDGRWLYDWVPADVW